MSNGKLYRLCARENLNFFNNKIFVQKHLPEEKPRMLCAVWRPDTVLQAVRAGIDIFDTSYPLVRVVLITCRCRVAYMQSCTSLRRNTEGKVWVHGRSLHVDAKLHTSGTEDKFWVHGHSLHVGAKFHRSGIEYKCEVYGHSLHVDAKFHRSGIEYKCEVYGHSLHVDAELYLTLQEHSLCT